MNVTRTSVALGLLLIASAGEANGQQGIFRLHSAGNSSKPLELKSSYGLLWDMQSGDPEKSAAAMHYLLRHPEKAGPIFPQLAWQYDPTRPDVREHHRLLTLAERYATTAEFVQIAADLCRSSFTLENEILRLGILARHMGKTTEGAIPYLEAAMLDMNKHSTVRHAIARLFEEKKLLQILDDALKGEDDGRCSGALAYLSESRLMFDDRLSGTIGRLLDKNGNAHGAFVAQTLAKQIPDARVMDLLFSHMENRDVMACVSLAVDRDPKKEAHIVRRAARELESTPPAGARANLLSLVHRQGLRDLRKNAAEFRKAAKPYLSPALSRGNGSDAQAEDCNDSHTRRQAARALLRISLAVGPGPIRDSIETDVAGALDDEDFFVRLECIEALGISSSRPAFAALWKHLEALEKRKIDKSWPLTAELELCLQALWRTGGERGFDELGIADSAFRRGFATTILERSDMPEAKAYLRKLKGASKE